MIEILGYIAVAFTAISFLMNNIINLRILNLIACLLFVIYSYSKQDYPILVINVFVALINMYYLYKNYKTKIC